LTAPLVLAFLALGFLGLCSPRIPRPPRLILRAVTSLLLVVMAWVIWYLPQVTIQEGVAGYGVVAVAYVVLSHVLLRHTTVPHPA
jgi:hypothetical protein